MKYQPSENIKETLSTYSEADSNAVTGCLAVYHHIINLTNASDNEQGRMFSINFLHKSSAGFKRRLKAELNETLDKLQSLGVVSESALIATSTGKTKEVRYLAPAWLVGTFDELEAKLFDLLAAMPAAEVMPAVVTAPAAQPAAEGTPVAPRVYDGKAIRLLKDIFISFNGSTWTGKSGTVISDNYMLAKHLFDSGAPVVSLEDCDIAICPACYSQFIVDAEQSKDLTVLICLQDLIFYWNGSTIKRSRGEIESDYFLTKYMLGAHLPVSIARPDEYAACTKCRRVFAREIVLGAQSKSVHLQPGAIQPAPVPVPVGVAIPGGASLGVSEKVFPEMQDPLLKQIPDGCTIDQMLEQRFAELM